MAKLKYFVIAHMLDKNMNIVCWGEDRKDKINGNYKYHFFFKYKNAVNLAKRLSSIYSYEYTIEKFSNVNEAVKKGYILASDNKKYLDLLSIDEKDDYKYISSLTDLEDIQYEDEITIKEWDINEYEKAAIKESINDYNSGKVRPYEEIKREIENIVCRFDCTNCNINCVLGKD